MAVRVVIKNPGQPAAVRMISPTLETMQKIVGGYIKIVPFEGLRGTDLIFNEEGRMKGLPINVNLPEWGSILGPLLVVGRDEEGKPKSLSLNDANSAAAMLSAFSERDPWRTNPVPFGSAHPLHAELVRVAHETDPVRDVYVYAADLYCEDCGDAIREELTKQGEAPDDPDDESSYDSDDFPKGPYSDGGGEADSVQHCGSHETCLNAIELPRGSKIGAWLGNALTHEGVQNVCEAVQGGGAVAVLWGVWYEEDLDYARCAVPPKRKRVVYRGTRPMLPEDE